MNRLCIEMTHARKRKDAHKKHKRVFRLIPRLMKMVEGAHKTAQVTVLAHRREMALTEGRMRHLVKRLDKCV